MSSVGDLLPTISHLSAPYWDGLREGVLRVQRCQDCGQTWFPPSTHCPQCLSKHIEWHDTTGAGRVWSWVVFHRRYFAGIEPPYNVAFIELDEGPMMMSRILGAAPIHCDMRVVADFSQRIDERPIVTFRAA
jgi:uncharacterized OB-fold protein